MKLYYYFKEKKLGISIYSLFFVFLVSSLVLRNYYPGAYPVSIFFITLIFICSQYFDFDYRSFIGCALILITACPFLLIFKLNIMAEYFANYVYGFLVIGVAGYFLDNLREKLKLKSYFKVYKKVFLSILICFLLFSVFFAIRDYAYKKDYIILIKNKVIEVSKIAKNKYLKTFEKEVYYSKKEEVILENETLKENIIISCENLNFNENISGNLKVTGWAIEGNSKDNTGIDEIEFFIDGKPGKGNYLGSVPKHIVQGSNLTLDYITNLYLLSYNRRPESKEASFWVANLEWGILSYSDVAMLIVNNGEFNKTKLTNESFVKSLYKGLFNREADVESLKYWVGLLDSGNIDKNYITSFFINSDEFKILSDNYYSRVSIHKEPLNILRKEVGEKYGKQFYLSGFDFEFDSTKISNGEHTIFIYARSPIFGWDYITQKINIFN